MSEATREAIAVHQAAGSALRGRRRRQLRPRAGQRRRRWSCVHGVPTSSLPVPQAGPGAGRPGAARDRLRLPRARPRRSPRRTSTTRGRGSSRWTGEAIDALEIDRCHLVVHDIGGPIGCEWAVRNPESGALADGAEHDARRRDLPPPLDDGALRDAGGSARAGWRAPAAAPASELFYRQGIADRSAIPRAEVYAHYPPAQARATAGRAFLRIMRGFELTEEKQRFLWEGLGRAPLARPDRLGRARPGARPRPAARSRQQALGVDDPILLPAKHFLQEDQAPAIAHAIADLAAPLG